MRTLATRLSTHGRSLALVAAFLLALSMRVATIFLWQFRGLYGQDAYSYYDYAVRLRDALWYGQNIPPFFWPPAYPGAVVLSSVLFGMDTAAGQAVSLLAGTCTVVFTLLLASELAAWSGIERRAARWVGVLAGIWLACAGQLILYSTVIMADALGLGLAVLSAWLLVRFGRTQRILYLYLAAAALALAFLARIQMGLLGLPWTVFTLYIWYRSATPPAIMLRAGAGALLIGAVIVLPYMLWVWQNARAGSPAYAADPGFAQWSPLNFLRREFDTPDGHFEFSFPPSIYYAIAPLRGGALTPLVIPFLALGIYALWRRRAFSALVLLVGWCAAVYLFIGGMPWQNQRFAFPLFPPLAICAALGMMWLVTFAQTATARRFRLSTRLALAFIASVFCIQLAWGYYENNRFLNTVRDYTSIGIWLTQYVPADATVYTFTLSPMLQHETDLHIVELFFETPESLRAQVQGEQNFLIVDVHSLETQWAGTMPELDYKFLREKVGLQELGVKSGFTLYRIQSP